MAGSKIAAGANHSLYLDHNGALYAWGLNDRGQLGDGTTVDKYRGVKIEACLPPDDSIVDIDCGDKHSVLLTANGRVYVWGDNSHHQLGLGTISAVTTPKLLFDDKKAVKIACGSDFTLAIIENDGCYDLYAWGDNSAGQLGSGNKNQLSQPTKVYSWYDSCTGISCGRAHSVAIIDSNIWVWGDDTYCQLGLSNPRPMLTPHMLRGIEILSPEKVSCGAFHTMIKDVNGLWVFGDNSRGQLGTGDTKPYPAPVQVTLGSDIVDFSCGMYFNLVSASSGLYVWGDNSKGQLGFDPESYHQITTPAHPTAVPKSVSQMAGGSYHSLYEETSGIVYSIGSNNCVPLGDGTQKDTFNYTQVIFHE